ncbi:hypothetical protein DI09_40p140 [Mitosporidium daphniae]|uniref:Uncharacterized protein n=1 Tax=Mitosporidium daphniae TaxID=1485682 RepID=A0A098VQB6_9MICR|nr:uncharacterized protein DI09_40p140 [Mitosporidium daphniae]KGG51228.1 hypothetical protein DI09_40p140 [Mitosporidium daphniae]|eukprot:XP_013237655.1 uncharacterized protein DI09_40p140 [Mitosporidium daphniae]
MINSLILFIINIAILLASTSRCNEEFCLLNNGPYLLESENALFLSLVPNTDKKVAFTTYKSQASRFNVLFINKTNHEVVLELLGEPDGLFYFKNTLDCKSRFYKENPGCHWRLIRAAPTEIPISSEVSPLYYVQSVENTLPNLGSELIPDTVIALKELFDGAKGNLLSISKESLDCIYASSVLLPIEQLDDADRFRLAELKVDIASSLRLLDHSILSSLCVPDGAHKSPASENCSINEKTTEATIKALMHIRDQLVGHPMRKRLYASADLIPRLQTILFSNSEDEAIDSGEVELRICALKTVHSLITNSNIGIGYSFTLDYISFLTNSNIEAGQWNWALKALVVLTDRSYPSTTEAVRLIRKFSTILYQFKNSALAGYDYREVSIIMALLANFCISKPSLIFVLQNEGIVDWLFSYINNGCFYSIDECKLKLLDSITESYAEELSKYCMEILSASKTPCSVATPTIAVKKSQIRVSLLLLKKILALFQGDKYRALSSFQGVIPSVNNVDPLAKLLLAKMDSFPEEALDCFWSLLEELTKNEFPSFVLFESDEQRLEFVRILISHIKSNNEPLLVVALKTLRALSRNVQEMRSIRFDDLHRAELVQVLIDKLGYELRDFSPQFTGILLNVIANLSLEFAGLRLIDWLLNTFGKDSIFKLLSKEQYLPLLSNLTFTASHSLREEIANTHPITEVIFNTLQGRLRSPSTSDVFSINSALLAAMHMKNGLEFDKIITTIQQISETDFSAEIRQLAVEALGQLSPTVVSATRSLNSEERVPLPPPI